MFACAKVVPKAGADEIFVSYKCKVATSYTYFYIDLVNTTSITVPNDNSDPKRYKIAGLLAHSVLLDVP